MKGQAAPAGTTATTGGDTEAPAARDALPGHPSTSAAAERGAAAVRPGPGPYPEAEALERKLGDPWRDAGPYGFAAGVERDGTEEFPAAFADRLRRAGFRLSYLPPSLGGTLSSLEDTHVLVRAAARRDAGVMPAAMYSISAAMTVLALGSRAQQETVARWIADGREVAFALSEEQAGSDVLAGSCRLVPAPDGGWELTGTKWLVGRGASADAALVVARTGERGPSAFTAVLLGPGEMAHPGVRRGPVRPTTGMRGIDFADLVFDRVPVPAAAVVGAVGHGLAGAMRAQQVVRLMSTAGSLATADTALRTAVRFASAHRVGPTPAAALPYTARELDVAGAELYAADLTALVGSRLAHLAPARFGLCSSVVKRIGTRLTASAATRCRGVVGARSVLRTGPWAALDKAVRDNAMVEVIDTSVLGNLRAVALHLPGYAAAPGEEPAARHEAGERLSAVFRIGTPLPAFEPASLDLGARPRDDVLLGMFALAGPLTAELGRRGGWAAGQVQAVADRLAALVRDAAAAQADPSRSLRVSAELLDLADRACLLYAAAVAALTWWFNRDRALFGEAPGDTGWLAAVLAVLLDLDAGRDPRRSGAELAAAGRAAARQTASGALLTALPVRLADGAPSQDGVMPRPEDDIR